MIVPCAGVILSREDGEGPRGSARDPSPSSRLRMTPARRPIKTLERILSKAGIGSRTEARKWIAAGRVRVNGRVVDDPDTWVDLERDRVAFDGKPLRRETH